MSLRKSPAITPDLHAARQASAQHSTGPRTPCGKERSKMNALQHGERSDPSHHLLVMRALGEDPQEFEYLKKELLISYGPGDTLWTRQMDDLAKLYWRRRRVERAETGLMRRSLLEARERQEKRRREIEAATFDDPAALEVESTLPDHPDARLRLQLSYLKIIRQQAERRVSSQRQGRMLGQCWEKQTTWRQARICELLRPYRGPEAVEREAPELLRLLGAEIASLEEQWTRAEEMNAEREALERDACLAPAGEEWRLLLRREETLGRAIDRKVRIALSMRQEYRKMGAPDNFLAETPLQPTAPLTREEVAAVKELIWGKEVASVIQDDDEDIMSLPRPTAPLPSNSHERTENVYENKGSEAVEAAAAAEPEEVEMSAPGPSRQGPQPRPSPAAQEV